MTWGPSPTASLYPVWRLWRALNTKAKVMGQRDIELSDGTLISCAAMLPREANRIRDEIIVAVQLRDLVDSY